MAIFQNQEASDIYLDCQLITKKRKEGGSEGKIEGRKEGMKEKERGREGKENQSNSKDPATQAEAN